MALLDDFSTGISSHFRAWRFIRRHRLWLFFLYPVLLLAVLFPAGIFSIWSLGTSVAGSTWNLVSDNKEHLDTGIGWLNSILLGLLHVITFLAGWVVRILLTLVVWKIARYIVLIFCSPMMARLSERVDEIHCGKKFPFDFRQFLKDTMRGVLVNIRNMLLESLWVLLLFIIGWIPVIGWLSAFFVIIVGWYFLGFNMMDYSCERRRMRISAGARFIRKHKGIAIGNGMTFSLLLLIPVAGIVIAPVLSPVAATLASLDRLDAHENSKT
ncbi:MAG TPA: EI24 domain-containing protein [Bacteroidia bacterium]|nr:EI24 domain-containing protein [Bacteroidia bacterium]